MFTKFRRDKRGGFAIGTSLFLSVFVLVGFAGFDVYYASIQKVNFQELVKAACYRSLNPTRTHVPDDTQRQEFAEKAVDATLAKGRYENVTRTVVSTWLHTSVNATASIPVPIGIMGPDHFELAAAFECSGIPPYPHDGEVLLSSDFTTGEGDALTLPFAHYRGSKCWGRFDNETIGWDGMAGMPPSGGMDAMRIGSNGWIQGRGFVEIQDWTPGNRCWNNPYPPNEFGSNYAIELDSDYNTSIYKKLELHPGTYRFELWYFGRLNNTSTNGIRVSIEGARNENPIAKQTMIETASNARDGWLYHQFEFTIDHYEIYKVYLEAVGTSDSFGGIINGFKLIYVDDRLS
ncbi:MAG: hypothetical protein AAF940_07690 [Pseudomonadota bacterium]